MRQMEGDGRAKDVLQKEKRAQQTSVTAKTERAMQLGNAVKRGRRDERDAEASGPDKAGHTRA